MFYFFYKIIIFSLNKEKDDIRKAYVYLSFFHGTVASVTFHNLEIFIFVLHSAMKTYLQTNQYARTIQIIL